MSLHAEEMGELHLAMAEDNLVGIADGIADLIYVLLGTACTYGIDVDHVWGEVQRSNMSKRGGVKREDGKLVKPPTYSPADIRSVLRQQGWEG